MQNKFEYNRNEVCRTRRVAGWLREKEMQKLAVRSIFI